MIQISGLSDISIAKTAGDSAIADQESTACVYMKGGDSYSVTLTANPLISDGKHYPYGIEVYQNSITTPSIELEVTDSQESNSAFGFEASTAPGCASARKLNIRISDVDSTDFTEAFTATATVSISVAPQ